MIAHTYLVRNFFKKPGRHKRCRISTRLAQDRHKLSCSSETTLIVKSTVIHNHRALDESIVMIIITMMITILNNVNRSSNYIVRKKKSDALTQENTYASLPNVKGIIKSYCFGAAILTPKYLDEDYNID